MAKVFCTRLFVIRRGKPLYSDTDRKDLLIYAMATSKFCIVSSGRVVTCHCPICIMFVTDLKV